MGEDLLGRQSSRRRGLATAHALDKVRCGGPADEAIELGEQELLEGLPAPGRSSGELPMDVLGDISNRDAPKAHSIKLAAIAAYCNQTCGAVPRLGSRWCWGPPKPRMKLPLGMGQRGSSDERRMPAQNAANRTGGPAQIGTSASAYQSRIRTAARAGSPTYPPAVAP